MQQASRFQAGVIEMEVMPDHVHLLIEIDPQFGIHKLIKAIKGYTSRVLGMSYQLILDCSTIQTPVSGRVN
jgi:putative transposase